MGKEIPRTGLVIRVYSKPEVSEEDITKTIDRAVKNARKAIELKIGSAPAFARVIFVVPVEYDDGKTAGRLRYAFAEAGLGGEVLEVTGHHSREALNQALRELAGGGMEYGGMPPNSGMQYGIILSGKAVAYLTPATVEAMYDAFTDGAKIVGVATDELVEGIKEGRVQNTFAGWDLQALLNLEPSGFDSPSGVEEYAPTVRLLRKFGKCIAVLVPRDLPPLNIRDNSDGRARHEEVMATKVARQQEESMRVGGTFEYIKAGVIPGYPKVV